MKYDFDQVNDRRNTNSLKWNVKEDELPMWVADMDFQTAPCVKEAIQNRSASGIYGYSEIPEAYYESFQAWWKRRHNFTIKREWMIHSNGVIPALSSIIRKLTNVAEGICLLSPVYNIFYNSIRNNGRSVITSDLQYKDGIYSIDFDNLEEKLKNPQTTMLILCNPHNPIGKLWNRQELEKIGNLCVKYHVIVVSDEIHCDLSEPSKNYIPFAYINEQFAQISITCIAASKAFNLAGLQAACVVVPNEVLRHKVWRALNTDEVAEPNVFACEATIAAFQKGEEWLEELRIYIHQNKSIAQRYLRQHLPHLRYIESNATYLIWIDCQKLYPLVDQFCTYLHKEKQLIVSSGLQYGKNGMNFIRMNVACPQAQLMDGLQRLKEGTDEFFAKYIDIC